MMKRGRKSLGHRRGRRIEALEDRAMLAGFTAYNGLFSSAETNENTTFYADSSGHDSAGPLVDIETGDATQVLLSTSQVGVTFGGNGAQPPSGSEAHAIFDGFVDFSAGGARSLEISSGDAYQYSFENLDAGATYEFAGTAVRGNSGYTNRWTLIELQSAESATVAHSTGMGVVTDGLPPNQVAIWTGDNASSGQGYVAQWRDIDPGADGVFHVVSTQYTGPVPTQIDAGGQANGSKGYGIAGIRLIENVPAGPPVVENLSVTDLMAFEATVGGRITTTGGQVPDATIYYGEVDGGMNVAVWQHSIKVGKASREFTANLDNLDQGTTYYYRSFAQNTLGSDWSDTSESFTTLSAGPPEVQIVPAANVGAFAAELSGRIVDTGNDTPIVTLYYGENDGGTIPRAWDASMELGVQSGTFAALVADLEPTTQYYFTAFAQNSLGNDWAESSMSFTTTETPPLQISEFMSDNATTLTTRVRNAPGDSFRGDQLTPDWIELHNPTEQVADIGGFHITDDRGQPRQWQIPAGTLIPARGYLAIFASGLDLRDARLDERGNLHTNFQLDSSPGAELVLTDADGEIVFELIDLPVQSEDVSYGVDAAGTERFYGLPTPGVDNANDVPKAPLISVASRTFRDSIVVELTPALPTHTIRYTLNEQTPTASSAVYGGPITIDRTTQLRAISVAPNGKSSTIAGESYVQLATSVLDDTSDLPIVVVETFGDAIPGSSSFGDAFVAIIEPGEDGQAQLTDAFDVQTRAGIHVRGSSSAGFSKKQYRVEFWDQQDEDQKFGVLGLPKEADWIFYGPGQFDRSFLANPLMFDLSNQIGRYATRTRWVEMYLNANGGQLNSSDYVGLYAITEVIEQGDDRVDVEPLTTGAGGVPVAGGFIWKNDRGSAYVDPEVTTSAQRRYIDGWIDDLRDAAAGPNFKDPNLGYERYADVGSFIDHSILNLVAMNVDALRLSSFYYKSADGKLEAGPVWDFDRSLDSTDGRDNNPRSWFGSGDSTRYFDDNDRVMSWWPDMFQDPDFVQRYIDRWFELRQDELSLENINATIDAHAGQIQDAAPRDYRRWSGSRYGNFAGEIRHLKDWLEDRLLWIDSKWLAAPAFSLATPQVPQGTTVSLTSSTGTIYYTLDGSDPRGENGAIRSEAIQADRPIPVDGFTRITARVYRAGHGTNNGYVATGDDWSAPSVGIYFNDPPAAAGNLVISEVNYNPAKPTLEEQQRGFDDNDDFEFVELMNVSDQNLVLTGSRLVLVDVDGDSEGIAFDLSDSPIATLAPGERLVVVENMEAFRARYGEGLPLAGGWSGGLSNNRELLTLLSYDDAVIQQFSYNDSGLWPGRADGSGSSLVMRDPEGDASDPENWRPSVAFHGSPGEADADSLGVVVNELLAHTDPPLTPSDSIELLNTSATSVDISGWFLSDSDDDLLKYRVPDGTVLGPGEFIVFDESDFNPTPLSPRANNFALSSARGDDVWLVVAEGNSPVLFSDDVHFGATPNGESFGRIPDGGGVFAPLSARTLGGPNAPPRIGPLVISELNYHPGSPTIGAIVLDPTITADDLEYVEIFNPTGAAIDLTNWRLRGGVDDDFDPGLQIPAGGTLVMISFDPDKPENVNRLAAFRAHYQLDESVQLVGGYSGHLNDSGESVWIERPDQPPAEDPTFIPRLLEDEVRYDVAAPWPNANGSAMSLTRTSTSGLGSFPTSWSAEPPSPGRTDLDVEPPTGDLNRDGRIDSQDIDLVCAEVDSGGRSFDLNADGMVDRVDVEWLVTGILGTTAGDANADGLFDSTDLIQVFQAGEYEDGVFGNSLWSEGDWNCDGDFDSSDLIVAFQAGSYAAGAAAAVAAASLPAAGTTAIPDLSIRSRSDANAATAGGISVPSVVRRQMAVQHAREEINAAHDLIFDASESPLEAAVDRQLDDLDLDLLAPGFSARNFGSSIS